MVISGADNHRYLSGTVKGTCEGYDSSIAFLHCVLTPGLLAPGGIAEKSIRARIITAFSELSTPNCNINRLYRIYIICCRPFEEYPERFQVGTN